MLPIHCRTTTGPSIRGARSFVLLLATLLMLPGIAACGGDPVRTTPSDVDGQNPTGGVNAAEWLQTDPVLLISFDGFRSDLSTYTYRGWYISTTNTGSREM